MLFDGAGDGVWFVWLWLFWDRVVGSGRLLGIISSLSSVNNGSISFYTPYSMKNRQFFIFILSLVTMAFYIQAL